MKRIVSVSLGSSSRDKATETEFLGVPFRLERIGTDGDRARYERLIAELDGKVDCFGIGGMDVYLHAAGTRFVFREPAEMVRGAQKTPWVDGSGLRNTLERQAVESLHASGALDLSDKKVLMIGAVDRFGMADAIAARAKKITIGDAPFSLNLPLPITSWSLFQKLAWVTLPLVVRLPFRWFYPVGKKQDGNTPRYPRLFEEADVIAGEYHYVSRYLPEKVEGKTLLTSSIREREVDWLRSRGIKRLITTMPQFNGEAFSSNLMEGVIVALSGKRPEELTAEDYYSYLAQLGWKPVVRDL